MAWLEDYDPTPSTQYDMQLEPGPPSLTRAIAILAVFLFLSGAIWWMAKALHTSLPKGEEPIMVRTTPAVEPKTVIEEEKEAIPRPSQPPPAVGKKTVPEETEPPSARSPLSEADRHFLKASQYYEAKDYEGATEELRQGLAQEPDNAGQRAMLAMVLSYQGSWAESAEEYNNVLEQHPDDALLHLGLAVALHRQEKIDEAVASLERAVALDPELDEAQKMLNLLTQAPEGTLEKVWIEHNVMVKGWEGFWIHTACTANYWNDQEGALRVLFFKKDGRIVPGSFSNLVQDSGQAYIEGPFKPPHRKTRYKDLHLFFPYKGLRLEEGEHLLKVQLELVGPEGEVLDTRWSSLRMEVLKTAFGGAVEEARSSSPPATKTQ